MSHNKDSSKIDQISKNDEETLTDVDEKSEEIYLMEKSKEGDLESEK